MGTHRVSASRLYRRLMEREILGQPGAILARKSRCIQLTLKINTFKEKEASLYTLNGFI